MHEFFTHHMADVYLHFMITMIVLVSLMHKKRHLLNTAMLKQANPKIQKRLMLLSCRGTEGSLALMGLLESKERRLVHYSFQNIFFAVNDARRHTLQH